MLQKLFTKNSFTENDFLKELNKDKFNGKTLQNILESNKININYVDSKGNSFLHHCLLNKKFKAAQWLVENNIDLTIKNNNNEHCLNIAINKKNKKIIQHILQKKQIDINERDKFGRNILQELVVEGEHDIAKLLIENGANINSMDKHHRNVIFDAMSYGDENFIMYLLSQDDIELNNIDDNLNTVLHHKEALTNDKIAKKLLEKGADPTIKNVSGETFLYKTALRGEEATELVDIALNHGADVDTKTANDNTIFMELVNAYSTLSSDEKERRSNLLAMSKHIVLKGADVNTINKDNETTLFQAVRKLDIELTSFLLFSGIDPNIQNIHYQTALSEITYMGIKNTDIVLLLLEYGASPIIKDKHGKTLFEVLNNIILHIHDKKPLNDDFLLKKIQAEGQYMVMLRLLLENNNLNLNYLNSQGSPLFFDPLLYDDYQLFRLYMKNGLNINTCNDAKHNIFYTYVEKVFKDNNTEIEFQSNLSRLLSHKVNHNFQDALGWTVMHKILSTPCNEKLFETLTKVVLFNYNITDNLGRSVIHNAVWNNQINMIRKIHIINSDIINIPDNYAILPITYAALLGSQELVILFIRLGSKVKSNNAVPLKAVKKFSPMLKNLPKLTEGLGEETLLNKIEILTSQIKRDFSSEK